MKERQLKSKLFKPAMLAATAVLVVSGLTGCVSDESRCPLPIVDIDFVTGGTISADFNELPVSSGSTEIDERSCRYSVNDGEAGLREVFIAWSANLQAFADLEEGMSPTTIGDVPALISHTDPTADMGEPSATILFEHDGYAWEIHSTGGSNVTETLPFAVRVESITNQSILIAESLVGRSFDASWWD
jgi:hypothetical protein